MPLATLVSGPAQRYALVKQNVVTHFRRFANHYAESVIDKQTLPNPGARVYLDPCEDTADMRYNAGNHVAFSSVKPARNAMQ